MRNLRAGWMIPWIAAVALSSGCQETSPDPEIPEGCGPATCAGCCVSGRCELGQNEESCGSDGEFCVACAAGEACLGGRCRPEGCGNDFVEEGEACDGQDLDGQSCESLGALSGELRCTELCTFDLAGCEGGACAVEEIHQGRCELCYQGDIYRCGDNCPLDPTSSFTDCGELECYELGPMRHECRQGGQQECDEASFIFYCRDEETMALCDEGWTTSWHCPTESPGFAVCAEGIHRAQCVAEDAERCTPGGEPSCEGDVHSSCSDNGFTERSDCTLYPEGGSCALTGRGAECVDPGTSACVPGPRASYCVGDVRYSCNEESAWESTLDCALYSDGRECREHPSGGADCALPGAVPCDETMELPWCEGEDRAATCYPGFLFSSSWDCGAGEVCALVDGSARCLPEGFETCDPASFEAGCVGGVAQNCDRGVIEEERCEGDNPICLDYGIGATCTFEGSATCDWSYAETCVSDSVLLYCATGGVERRYRCEGDCTCGVLEDGRDAVCFHESPFGGGPTVCDLPPDRA